MRLLLCVWWYTKVRFSDIWRKNNLTSGTDQVPSFLLKDCASVVIKPLTFLFNLALSSFTFPNVWKIARVCSVLKSGEPSFISNYRAISIFSNVAKFVEIVLCSDIRPAISQNISLFQHCFMERRSTVTNHTVLCSMWWNSLIFKAKLMCYAQTSRRHLTK